MYWIFIIIFEYNENIAYIQIRYDFFKFTTVFRLFSDLKYNRYDYFSTNIKIGDFFRKKLIVTRQGKNNHNNEPKNHNWFQNRWSVNKNRYPITLRLRFITRNKYYVLYKEHILRYHSITRISYFFCYLLIYFLLLCSSCILRVVSEKKCSPKIDSRTPLSAKCAS